MTSGQVPAAGLLYEDLIRLVRSIERIPRRSLVLPPAALIGFDAAAGPDRPAGSFMGFPVVFSNFLPAGHAALVAPTFGSPVPWPAPRFEVSDVARWFNVPARFLRRGRCRRLEVKRWIRNEINARRMAKAAM